MRNHLVEDPWVFLIMIFIDSVQDRAGDDGTDPGVGEGGGVGRQGSRVYHQVHIVLFNFN